MNQKARIDKIFANWDASENSDENTKYEDFIVDEYKALNAAISHEYGVWSAANKAEHQALRSAIKETYDVGLPAPLVRNQPRVKNSLNNNGVKVLSGLKKEFPKIRNKVDASCPKSFRPRLATTHTKIPENVNRPRKRLKTEINPLPGVKREFPNIRSKVDTSCPKSFRSRSNEM